ncbi:MAG: hypothetical protein JHC35_03745 [Sulfuricurvum sp.]|uniref:hypothetical protein n=1 Tax=Sulfuricurvum sp. TaxID=2025608 RepID=UPI0025D4C5AE|nr:hypothetical protein [Sulfuricurvum sp.]MCI4406389.1 hypothetical protein [Sulfuricurvum sp.]
MILKATFFERGISPLTILFFSLTTFSVTIWGDVLSIDNPANIQDKNDVFLTTSAFIATDPVSVKGFFDDNWGGNYTPRNGTNLALASARAEIGGTVNGWRIGYIHRLETMVEASRDFIDLIHTVKNSEDLPIGRQYNLDFKINGFQADGLHIAKAIPIYTSNDLNIQGGMGISLLRGIRTQQGLISGSATATSDKNYDFYGTVDYYYSSNYLYKLDVNTPTGYGASSDIGLCVDWGKFHSELAINDLLGFIQWDQAPYTNAILTSSTKSYDSNGYVQYSPTITGLEITKEHTQYFDPKGFASIRYNGEYILPFMQASTTRGYVFPEVGVIIPTTDTSTMKFSYETFFKSYGITFASKYAYLGFQTNNITFEKASAVGVNLGLKYLF